LSQHNTVTGDKALQAVRTECWGHSVTLTQNKSSDTALV